jgi:uncharacterized protein (DUF58 family)
MRSRIVLKNRILPILIAVLLIAAVLDDYAGWRLLLYALALAWLIGRLWVAALAVGLRLEREMRFGWAQVGDRLEERFTLLNFAPTPALWVEIRDQSTLPDYSIDQVTGIEYGARRTWRTSGVCSRRGVFTLGPLTLTSGDPLGLFTVELSDPRSVQLIVTPPVVSLPEVQVAAGGKTGEGRPRPHAPERTMSVSGVRQYAQGDSLRWIHWPTSARRDELFVRTFDHTSTGDWWIILDANAASQVGAGRRSTFEHAIILAASLADRGLRSGKAVGVAGLGKELLWLSPRTGDGQRWAILRALATFEPGDRPLGFLLGRMETTLAQARSLVLITPDVSAEWLQTLLPLAWRGAVPTALLLDPQTFGGQPAAEPLAEALARAGITHQVIPAALLDRPEAQPGQVGRYDWRVTPSGRAVAVGGTVESAWKGLGSRDGS